MLRAAVDIGTNSMRLLVVDESGGEISRIQRVTGLGGGVDASGRFDSEAVERTIEVLAAFGDVIKTIPVKRAVATSASRDASDRELFFDRAEQALGIRPEVISGMEEAELSYAGATEGAPGTHVVVDIGGGSSEFVWRGEAGLMARSFDIGSVRLTERALSNRPASFEEVETAASQCEVMFQGLDGLPDRFDVIGVAGTWTSLAAIAAESADRSAVHLFRLERTETDRMVGRLASMSLTAIAALPGLDPARAPVILAGAVVAREAMRALAADHVTVSERDLLDGVVASLEA
ncbi:MAG: hypothetical protein OEO77_07125 [Acidimicrobiia bacterium]|nr:hypothetical protein [Acidimicrobiia bacterium]